MINIIFGESPLDLVFAEKINFNYHSVPKENDELINSFKIFVLMFIDSLMFQ